MRPALLFAAAFTAVGLLCPPAGASVIFAIKPATISAAAPSTGDIFDVVLTNTGPGSLLVDGFSFEISVTSANITLTGANFSTSDPYIFAADSFDQINSLALNTSSGQKLDASDFTNDFADITINSGSTVGLGHIVFNVASGTTPGLYPVTFTGGPNFNSLSNSTGGVAIDQMVEANISVTGGATSAPEPETGALVPLALAVLLGVFKMRRHG
ncbi:MAG TPA: hypothetical protein VKE70_34505 [Candidatus Solibacter sp.]|nr:hypothetical protein [Candidatus Solibacter sp.]